MTIPVTFSAPGDGYEPSAEDCLRDGVWLMLYADNVNRKGYSFNEADASAGVRIVSGVAHTETNTGKLVVPQQIVTVAVPSNRFNFATGGAGEKSISIAIAHLERPETGYLDIDVDTPAMTPEQRLARTEEILMRGTLYAADITSAKGRVIDPYYTPKLGDGTYDPEQLLILNDRPPEITRMAPLPVRLRSPRNENEIFIDPLKDIGVAYSLVATYIVDLASRENMRRGGFANG